MVLDRLAKLMRGKRDYTQFEESSWGRRVLADLHKFCAADKSTFVGNDPNGRESARMEGRREVWLRIQSFLSLTESQLEKLREVQSDD